MRCSSGGRSAFGSSTSSTSRASRSRSPLLIAGAGMAGLCAAARARELGLDPQVLEKGEHPGGSMLLSSGVVWRYRSLEEFRRQCPGGDERLQREIVERLDEALAWLESLGAPVMTK